MPPINVGVSEGVGAGGSPVLTALLVLDGTLTLGSAEGVDDAGSELFPVVLELPGAGGFADGTAEDEAGALGVPDTAWGAALEGSGGLFEVRAGPAAPSELPQPEPKQLTQRASAVPAHVRLDANGLEGRRAAVRRVAVNPLPTK
jgi:hypothetical protein